MRVTILHTPADAEAPGLLCHLQEILDSSAIEVSTLVCSESGLPLPQYVGERLSAHGEELRRELQNRFEEHSPDTIVLSDRLNGSKPVAKRLASQNGIGVLVLKESVFPSRVFFAPEGRPPGRASEEGYEETGTPLEEYQKFRLDRALEEAFGIPDESPAPLFLNKRGRKFGLVIIDHSMHDSDGEALRHVWALVEEAKKGEAGIILCERWRDVCSDHADCGRFIVLAEGDIARRIPCRENQLRGLIRCCDWCATNGSLHALEVLFLGKPVIVTDGCVYAGRGFTSDLQRIDDCKNALRRVLDEPHLNELHKERLQKFLYGFLFSDLLRVNKSKSRFCEQSEQRVLDALFRALPLERGARVLPGAAR